MIRLNDQIIRFLILCAGKKSNRYGTAFIITVVSIVVSLVLILSAICTYLRGRKTEKILDGNSFFLSFASTFLSFSFHHLQLYFFFIKIIETHDGNKYADLLMDSPGLKMNFKDIRSATNNFSDELGRGGFGAVYMVKIKLSKYTVHSRLFDSLNAAIADRSSISIFIFIFLLGILRSNEEEIAVKRLSMQSSHGELEFNNEILTLAKLHHHNLVKLRGFCVKKRERLLVYEFVPNGSLDRYIFGMHI